jgi:hypothetical protein
LGNKTRVAIGCRSAEPGGGACGRRGRAPSRGANAQRALALDDNAAPRLINPIASFQPILSWVSRLLKNYAEPPLRSESAVRKTARKGVSSPRLSPSELTPRKRFLAQPEGQHRFGPGAALELPGKAVEALHRQFCLARGPNRVLRRPAEFFSSLLGLRRCARGGAPLFLWCRVVWFGLYTGASLAVILAGRNRPVFLCSPIPCACADSCVARLWLGQNG